MGFFTRNDMEDNTNIIYQLPTVRLTRALKSNPEIAKWYKRQTNYSASIIELILQYIEEYGVTNVLNDKRDKNGKYHKKEYKFSDCEHRNR